jgi:hypothetical protein
MTYIKEYRSLRLVGSEHIDCTDYKYMVIRSNSKITIYFKSMNYGSRRLNLDTILP